MKSRLIIILFVITPTIFCMDTSAISQWRGPNRDGIYPETNLLKEWPETGPELLWSFTGLGDGHGNVGFGKNALYICGMPDTIGILYCLDFQGELLWKKAYGLEWYKNYTGPRSTPTVIDDLVYFESGHGEVFCFNGNTGELVWSIDLLQKFSAENIQWGMAESLLIEGDVIFCTPGGKEHNVVALNRFNGKTIWTSPGNRQPAAYCSPIIIERGPNRLLITMTSKSIIGIDAISGEFYWSIDQYQDNQIHANTPVYSDGKILCSSASDKSDVDGTVQIQLSEDGENATINWRNQKITNLMNGFILKDGYVYGSPFNKKEWYCFDWNTGEIQYISNRLNSGAVIYADGLFYCYTYNGEMALVSATPENFQVVSIFDIPLGTKQYWAHPVIKKGRLYVRHGDALMTYDISKK